MPNAWDITATGAAPELGRLRQRPPTAPPTRPCTAVYTFLSKQAGYDPSNPKAANNSLSTYATNPLWQVVDGPWKLTHFDASGQRDLRAQHDLLGPDQADAQEVHGAALHLGLGRVQRPGRRQGRRGLPAAARTSPQPTTNPLVAGPEQPAPVATSRWTRCTAGRINYFPYNFNSTGDDGNAGKIFNQLYFRQAVQYLVDQPLYNQKIYKGYGVGTYGPVPVTPANSFVSSEVKNNPYPYNPTQGRDAAEGPRLEGGAQRHLHLRHARDGGQPVRRRHPGRGAKLAFNLQYATGIDDRSPS